MYSLLNLQFPNLKLYFSNLKLYFPNLELYFSNLNIYFSNNYFLLCTSYRPFPDFRLLELYIWQELFPLNVDSRAPFHSKVY